MSKGEFKLGVAGLTHGHIGGILDTWKKAEGVRFAAIAETDTDLLEDYLAGFDGSYSSWAEMLEKETLDGLVVTSNNVESSEIAVQALKKGVSCFVEKPMATNLADAERMLAAKKEGGATLMINWPFAWDPSLHALKARIEAGEIGAAFHLKYRNGHRGPREIGCGPEFVSWLYDETLNGGGAIADFGSYGALLCRWILGMPETVYGVRGNYTKDYDISDDHATCVLKYAKADAVIEATWATNGFDVSANPVVHGVTGTLGVFGKEIELARAGSAPVRTESPALPVSNAAEYFMDCVRNSKEPEGLLNPELCADGVRILDAALKSTKSGCAERP